MARFLDLPPRPSRRRRGLPGPGRKRAAGALPPDSAGRNQRQEVKMDWIQQLGGILDRYEAAPAGSVPPSVRDDFDRLSRVLPRTTLADGLAAAFRSERTPPFGRMLACL